MFLLYNVVMIFVLVAQFFIIVYSKWMNCDTQKEAVLVPCLSFRFTAEWWEFHGVEWFNILGASPSSEGGGLSCTLPSRFMIEIIHSTRWWPKTIIQILLSLCQTWSNKIKRCDLLCKCHKKFAVCTISTTLDYCKFKAITLVKDTAVWQSKRSQSY